MELGGFTLVLVEFLGECVVGEGDPVYEDFILFFEVCDFFFEVFDLCGVGLVFGWVFLRSAF